ncbi:MAG: DUF2911 domain-containing protein [Gemmatimonadaceae bacterium]
MTRRALKVGCPAGTALALICAAPLLLRAQTVTPISGAFVLRLGRDTVAMERYQRTDNRLDGDVVMRVPSTVRVRYSTEFGRDGRVRRSTARIDALGSKAAQEGRKVTVDVLGDSIRVVTDSGALHRTEMRRGAPDLVPLIAGPYATSYATYEWLIGRAKDGDTVRFNVMSPVTARLGTALFVRHNKQRAEIDFFGETFMDASFDDNGRLVAVDANMLTVRTNVERVADVDIGGAAARFAALDHKGRGLGTMSPPDSVRATVDGVRIAIDYGSPRARGRQVLGGLVPYSLVWRTGANAATTLSIDGDLSIGGQRLPAGTYSIWTIPSPDHPELIINAQHGQWGTEYNDTKDVAKVSLRSADVAESQEQFTIRVTPDNLLRFRWSTFEWTVPLSRP